MSQFVCPEYLLSCIIESLGNNIPRPTHVLRYLRTLYVALKCVIVGADKNWLNCCVQNVIPGLVAFKYNNLPTSIMYVWMYDYGGLESRWSLTAELDGAETSLDSVKNDSSKIPIQYFLWHNNIPSFEWATLMHIKYFSLPKSLILKALS